MSNELKYQRIIQAALAEPWAILPSKLAVIQQLIAFRAEGGQLSEEEIKARIGEPRSDAMKKVARSGKHPSTRSEGQPQQQTGGAVAILPLLGTIIPRANLMSEMSGGTSVQRFTNNLRQALRDPDVASIVIDVDSPGGQVGGVPELADEIYQSRGDKRIVAVANTLAASAAYWIGSAADELVVTPSGEVGSVGVVAMHEDWSKFLEEKGVKVTFIHAGEHKVEGNAYEPLDDEAKAFFQSRVDDYYGMFVDAVARGRGVSPATVKADFGQGRTFGGREAVRLGMADRIETLDAVVDRLLTPSQPPPGRGRGRSASAELRKRRLRLHENS